MSQKSTKVVKSSSKIKNTYSKLPEDVKKSFVATLKATTNQSFWVEVAEKFRLRVSQIEFIKKKVLENTDDDYSPYVDIIQCCEDAERSVNTIFVVLGNFGAIEAIKLLKDHVDEKYHQILDGDFDVPGITVDLTLPDISILMRSSEDKTVQETPPVTMSSHNLSSVPDVDYEELELATENWNSSFKLGQGGFASVYLGKWKNTEVAIKRIELHKSIAVSRNENERLWIELKQSLNELRFLNQCRHDNILQIFGYSATKDKPHCIIYEYMRGGTLQDKLKSPDSFPWPMKVRILIEAAKGLQFLHEFKNPMAIIHGDVKPANILLDQHGHAKIGDFGLARESATKAGKIISRIYGTKPYLPNEFLKYRKLSSKVDSYSFGIVLFEVATRKPVIDKSRDPSDLKSLVKNFHTSFNKNTKEDLIRSIMDINSGPIDFNIQKQIFMALIEIGLECIHDEEEKRLEMKAVFEKLSKTFVA